MEIGKKLVTFLGIFLMFTISAFSAQGYGVEPEYNAHQGYDIPQGYDAVPGYGAAPTYTAPAYGAPSYGSYAETATSDPTSVIYGFGVFIVALIFFIIFVILVCASCSSAGVITTQFSSCFNTCSGKSKRRRKDC